VVLLLVILLLTQKLNLLKLPIKTLALLFVSANLLAVNWLIFVFAILNDQIVDTSLGYFMNPLVSVFLGMFFLGERLRSWQAIALALAFVGILIQLIFLGSVPLISLTLAFSFGFYGLLRKNLNLPSVSGLAIETLLVLPFAVVYLSWQYHQGDIAFGQINPSTDLLLMLGGVITSLPLLCFAAAVTRLSLTAVGIFQYLAPSLSLLIAVFYFHEPFTKVQLMSFGCVWTAIVMFTIESIQFHRKPLIQTQQVNHP
jgi:chloramphenicol-sensitive protein RarD